MMRPTVVAGGRASCPAAVARAGGDANRMVRSPSRLTTSKMLRRVAGVAAITILLVTHQAEAREGHGGSAYALPGNALSANQPSAYPRGDVSTFAKDLDLPEPGHYQQEVVRVVQGGFFPATVAELAVVWPGRPVQVMLVPAQRRESMLLAPPSSRQGATWVVTSRIFSSVSWEAFAALRNSLLSTIERTAAKTQTYDRNPRRLDMICTDDGGGSLAYGSGHVYSFNVLLSGCGNDAVRTLEERVIALAESLTRRAPNEHP